MLIELLPGALRLAVLAGGVTGMLYWLSVRYLAQDVPGGLHISAGFPAVAGFLFAYGREISLLPLGLPAAPLTKLPFLLLLALGAGVAAGRYPQRRNAILGILALIAVFWCAGADVGDNKIRVGLLALLGVAAAQSIDFEGDGATGAMAALLAALLGMALIAMIWGSHLGPFALALAAALAMALAAPGNAPGPALIAPALAGWLVLVAGVALARPILLIPAALSAAPLLLEASVRSLAGRRRFYYWLGLAGVCLAELGFALAFVTRNL